MSIQLTAILAGVMLFAITVYGDPAMGSMSKWHVIELDVPQEANEAAWRDALAKHWNGKTETVVPFGRIDVETDLYVVELDWFRKWHEGLGQALHYAEVRKGKQGIVALIVRESCDKAKLDFIEELLGKYDVYLIVLIRKMEE